LLEASRVLPDWDFGGDEAKRRAFVTWVEAELDRFAGLLHDRDRATDLPNDWKALAMRHVLKTGRPHRPADPYDGMNAKVWEFGLLRYMFRRYWPNRKRPLADPASAASIAVVRCRRALARKDRTPDRLAATSERVAEEARLLFEEWERGTRTPGRKQAEADVAFLNTLPPDRFAR
jgi:hypothetical protein